MTPSARIAATIELLSDYDPILRGKRSGPALDVYLKRAFRQRRYAGSSDREDISERIYHVIRNYGRLAWRLESAGQQLTARNLVMLSLALDERLEEIDGAAGPYGAEPAGDDERRWLDRAYDLTLAQAPAAARWNLPEWLVTSVEMRFGDDAEAELIALDSRAPTDIRVNTLKTSREKVLESLARDGIVAEATPFSPLGIRLYKAPGLINHDVIRRGDTAIQDEGSQIAGLLCDVRPRQQVADMCAGAGGKSLAFAAAMENTGQIYAFDVDKKRIEVLKARAQLAGVHNIQPKNISSRPGDRRGRALRPHLGQMDRVIVDAPCSGSGTWRRNPELKWRMTSEAIDDMCLRQADLLEEAAQLVAPGGRLIYITCSILPEENENQVQAFLDLNDGWSLVDYSEILAGKKIGPIGSDCSTIAQCLQLTPGRHATDGFFIAVFDTAS